MSGETLLLLVIILPAITGLLIPLFQAVTQIQEGQVTVVTPAVDPAGQGDLGSDVFGAKLSTGVATQHLNGLQVDQLSIDANAWETLGRP